MQEKVQNRDVNKEQSFKSELFKNEDRSRKTIKEKHEIHSDGPRSDSDVNTAAETQLPLPIHG